MVSTNYCKMQLPGQQSLDGRLPQNSEYDYDKRCMVGDRRPGLNLLAAGMSAVFTK